ncbi:hypothetical protein HKD27_09105 [Gluconobacter sp. R75690]|uniref:Uncharacterized protein n=1 Tax=Gluconobacter oxydans NBRC 3293 TaxID=1315969 RepID=A0A829X4T2_GLUOY|nr:MULTISPECIES: hypothetical protein [Gluconobacter]MBF0851076.1 hypothetical protein [Gluconobacter sp. R75690]MBF0879768.1 hypothetical protein [Gluconobacter sp. R75828]GEM17847.1 hypothetical protein NBRC3293_2344 [Gluconobacter oxydans NBRC 3293]
MPDEAVGNTELLERVVRIETKQEHLEDTTGSLSDRVATLEDTVKSGFASLSAKMDSLNSRRAMVIAGGSGVGGGVAVGLYSLARLLWHL